MPTNNILYCLSESEFSVLQSAYGIDRLLCFEEPVQKENCSLQRQYHQGIADLYKRGLLVAENGRFSVAEPMASMFQILKNCSRIMKLECMDVSFQTKLFYFSGSDCFVLLIPGMQKEEYVRAEMHQSKALRVFLEEQITQDIELVTGDENTEMKLTFLDCEQGREQASISMRQKTLSEKNVRRLSEVDQIMEFIHQFVEV